MKYIKKGLRLGLIKHNDIVEIRVSKNNTKTCKINKGGWIDMHGFKKIRLHTLERWGRIYFKYQRSKLRLMYLKRTGENMHELKKKIENIKEK